MRTRIYFAIIAMITAPAWADLNWDTPTFYTSGPLDSVLTDLGADVGVRNYFNSQNVITRELTGANMGAIYAAALGNNIAPVAAVDAGYEFMQRLIAEQNKENNSNVVIGKSGGASAGDDNNNKESGDDTDDENKNNESNGDASDNTFIGDATDMLRAELDAKCSQLNVLKTFVPASGKLDCVRVGDTDAFQCNYSRKYNSSNGIRHLICTTHNKPFTAHFSSDGKSLLDNNAVIGAFEDNAGANKQTASQNTPDSKTVVTNVTIAQEIVDKWAQMKCAMASGTGNYDVRESDVKCEMRDNNNFVCRCRYSIAFSGYTPRTCTVGYNGIVYTDGTLGGTFGVANVTGVGALTKDVVIQPMTQINPFDTSPELIPAHEKTKKEIRQETRAINKQLREIERADKAEQKAAKKAAKTASADEEVPTQVVPISDGTDVDLNPVVQMDEFMDELMSMETTPTKKEQRAAAREARQAQTAQKKQERQENRQNRKNSATSSDTATAPISAGVDVPIDILGDLDPVLYQGGYYSNM